METTANDSSAESETPSPPAPSSSSFRQPRVKARLCCAALAGMTTGLMFVLVRHHFRPDPCIGVNCVLLAFVGGVASLTLTMLSGGLRASATFARYCVILSLLFGAIVGVHSTYMECPLEPRLMTGFAATESVSSAAAELLDQVYGDAAAAAKLRRLPYVAPVLTGCTVALSVAAGFIFIYLLAPPTPWVLKAASYFALMAAVLIVRASVPCVLLADPPSERTMQLGFGTRSWLVLPLLAVVTDLGQLWGGSDRFARYWKRFTAAFGLAVVLLLGLSWKPLVAEYCYWRGTFSANPAQAADAYALAYGLSPANERNAHAYATRVLAVEGAEYVGRREYEAALNAQWNALRVSPGDPELKSDLACTYARMGDLDRAFHYHKEAMVAANSLTAEDYRRWFAFGLPASEFEKQLIHAMGQHGGERSLREVGAFLSHKDADLVVAAAQTLGHVGGVEWIGALEDMLQHESAAVRQATHLALRRIRSRTGPKDKGI